MPGVSSGLTASSPTLEAAFRSALLSQGTLAFLIFVLLAIAWVACREALLARDRARLIAHLAAARASRLPEPAARKVLRIGFGTLWILDGLLQAQPAMPGGLPSQVIEPAAAGSTHWVLNLVSWSGTLWSYHPVQVDLRSGGASSRRSFAAIVRGRTGASRRAVDTVAAGVRPASGGLPGLSNLPGGGDAVGDAGR